MGMLRARGSLAKRGVVLHNVPAASVDGEEDAADAESDVEEVEDIVEEAAALDALPEGFELVSAVEEPELAFAMEEDDPEMTFESVAAFEALDPEVVERELVLDGMPVPPGELVHGKVRSSVCGSSAWAG
jgi:hypothetical protein